MKTKAIMDSNIVGYIVELGVNVAKDKIERQQDKKAIRERLKKFIERKNNENFNCTKEEEIDFQGLVDYIQSNFLEDVKSRLFGDRKERGIARNKIINEAVYYSKAHTSISCKRVIILTGNAIDILYDFYKRKINSELKFIAAQIEDTVDDITTEQTKEIKNELHCCEENIVGILSNKIENNEALSIEHGMQCMKNGKVEQIENKLANFLDAIGSSHILFPDYMFEYKPEQHRFYSKPLTKEGLREYPPRIVCRGTIQMKGKYLDKFDVNTIEYANRHQLPITLNVLTAKKMLGDIDDPIQKEAEMLIGEEIVLEPAPFPPAVPCSISLNGEVIFDYILLRTEEILDDGTIVISNCEQGNCPFIIKMLANIESKITTYTIKTCEPTNKELLQYLKFLKRVSLGEKLSVKILSTGEVLASGKLEDLEYKTGFDSIEAELDFIEKIVSIEQYFNDTISIPEEITVDDYQTVSYLALIINGKECVGSWNKLEFSMKLTEDLKEKIEKEENKKFVLSYIGSMKISVYGKEYELSVIRKFTSVIYQDIERLKKRPRC